MAHAPPLETQFIVHPRETKLREMQGQALGILLLPNRRTFFSTNFIMQGVSVPLKLHSNARRLIGGHVTIPTSYFECNLNVDNVMQHGGMELCPALCWPHNKELTSLAIDQFAILRKPLDKFCKVCESQENQPGHHTVNAHSSRTVDHQQAKERQ